MHNESRIFFNKRLVCFVAYLFQIFNVWFGIEFGYFGGNKPKLSFMNFNLNKDDRKLYFDVFHIWKIGLTLIFVLDTDGIY